MEQEKAGSLSTSERSYLQAQIMKKISHLHIPFAQKLKLARTCIEQLKPNAKSNATSE